MKTIWAYFKLFRPLNLGIMAATLYLVREFVIIPFLGLYAYGPLLSEGYFLLLVLSVVLVGAAGNGFNDHLDRATDAYNRPGKRAAALGASGKYLLSVSWVLGVLGVVLTTLVAREVGVMVLAAIPLMCLGLLWYYSALYKHIILLGNAVVAFLCALVVLMPLLFEPVLYHLYRIGELEPVRAIYLISGALALFAFLLTLMREAVKDLEDLPGDRKTGSDTLPLVLGAPVTHAWAVLLALAVMGGVGYLQYMQLQGNNYAHFLYLLLGVQMPLLVFCITIWMSRTPRQYRRQSALLKAVMVMGLGMVLFNYYVASKTPEAPEPEYQIQWE